MGRGKDARDPKAVEEEIADYHWSPVLGVMYLVTGKGAIYGSVKQLQSGVFETEIAEVKQKYIDETSAMQAVSERYEKEQELLLAAERRRRDAAEKKDDKPKKDDKEKKDARKDS